jgi:hypothetical protein
MLGFISTRKTIATTVLLLVFALLAVAMMSGCTQIGDGIAKLIGAPTSTQIKEASDKLDAAEKSIGELEDAKAAADRQVAALTATREKYETSRASITEAIAAVGQMLAGAIGDRRDVIMSQLDALRRQLALVDAQDSDAEQLAAEFASQIADIDAARMVAEREVSAAIDQLAAFDEQKAEAIARATGAVRAAGDAAGALGAPGAGAIGGVIADHLGEGLALILGGSTAVAVARGRKHKRDAKAAKEVIVATEEYGLLEGVDTGAKAAARKALSSAAVDLLTKVTSGVEKASKGPAATAAGA